MVSTKIEDLHYVLDLQRELLMTILPAFKIFNIKFNDSFCRFIENNFKITAFRSNFTSVKQTT